MKIMVLIVFLSSSSTQSVAFLNRLSILIIVKALRSENKFLEPLCPVVFLFASLLIFVSETEVSVVGRASGGIKTVVYS